MTNRFLFLTIHTALFFIAVPASAQDGGQLYATHCAACHAPEGQGQPAAGMPPLAGSRWVAGAPERSIQIVLHGMMGPIEVNGREYNSMMPAQGAIIPDDHIAAMLNYVRSTWGNKSSKEVTAEMVAAERKRTAQRAAPWEPIELLKQFPLPKEAVLFTRIEAEFKASDSAVEKKIPAAELPQNLLSMNAAGEPMPVGSLLTFSGELTAPRDDTYTLFLGTEFAVHFEVDGKERYKEEKSGSTSKSQTIELDLKEGVYPFILTLKKLKEESIAFSWKSRESPDPKSLIHGQMVAAKEKIELIPQGELYLYRGSIENAGSPRVIAVGSPVGLHYTFDPITGAPTLVWSGRFIDARRHWTDRGQGLESPMGREISRIVPGIAWLQELPDEWPIYDVEESETDVRKREVEYLGFQYDVDRLGLTFRYRIGEQEIKDHYRAADGKTLQRTITHLGAKPLFVKLLEREKGESISKRPSFLIDQSTTLEILELSKNLQWVHQDREAVKQPARQVGILEVSPNTKITLTYCRK